MQRPLVPWILGVKSQACFVCWRGFLAVMCSESTNFGPIQIYNKVLVLFLHLSIPFNFLDHLLILIRFLIIFGPLLIVCDIVSNMLVLSCFFLSCFFFQICSAKFYRNKKIWSSFFPQWKRLDWHLFLSGYGPFSCFNRPLGRDRVLEIQKNRRRSNLISFPSPPRDIR